MIDFFNHLTWPGSFALVGCAWAFAWLAAKLV